MSKALWISAFLLLIVNFTFDRSMASSPFAESDTMTQTQIENVVKISNEVTSINKKSFPSSREIASEVNPPDQVNGKEPELIKVSE